jgi:hypothetical protein
MSKLALVEIESLKKDAREFASRLQSLRKRTIFWNGVGEIASFVIIVLVASLALNVVEQYFRLNVTLRSIILVAYLASVGWLAARVLMQLLRPPTAVDVVRSIQTERLTERSNLVAAGMILERHESVATLDVPSIRAVGFAQKQLSQWKWDESLQVGRPVGWLICLLLLLMSLGFLSGRFPSSVSWARWSALVRPDDSTQDSLIVSKAPDYAVAGQSIEVEVTSTLAEDAVVSLSVEGQSNQPAAISESQGSLRKFQIANIQSDLVLQAFSGDVTSASRTIKLTEATEVVSHTYVVTPPAYTNQKPYETDRRELNVTKGSRVSLQVVTTKPDIRVQVYANQATSAEVAWDGFSGKPITLDGLESIASKNQIELSLMALEQEVAPYKLDYPLSVRFQADLPPVIVLQEINSEQRLVGEATDDFGLKSLGLSVQGISTATDRIDESLRESKQLKIESQNKVLPTKSAILEAVDIQALAAKWPTCDAIDLWVSAMDNATQEAYSNVIRISLRSEGSADFQFAQSMSQLIEQQRDIFDQTQELRDADEPDENELNEVQSNQESLAQQWQSFRESLNTSDQEMNQSAQRIQSLMNAVKAMLEQRQLEESLPLQDNIIQRMNELASEAAANSHSDTEPTNEQSQADRFKEWAARQLEASGLIEELMNNSNNELLEKLTEDERILQQELKEFLPSMEQDSNQRESLERATSALNRVVARLKRNRLDQALSSDAEEAKDELADLAQKSADEEREKLDRQRQSQQSNNDQQNGDENNNDPQNSIAGDQSGQPKDSTKEHQSPNQNQNEQTAQTPQISSGNLVSSQGQPNEVSGLPIGDVVVAPLDRVDVSGQANWGKLPDRLREQLRQRSSVDFVPGYESQTRDYFSALNEIVLRKREESK